MPSDNEVIVKGNLLEVPARAKVAGLYETRSIPEMRIVMGEGSSAAILIEGPEKCSLDLSLSPGASLSLARIGQGEANVHLSNDSFLNLFDVHTDAGNADSSWQTELLGAGASVRMHGVVIGGDAQKFHQDVKVWHRAPNTQSRVIYKTVLRGEANSVFHGLIHVGGSAVKTDAYQSSRSLLLSEGARADSIPVLEIETDDVKCGHGAAVSGLDEEQIFYLMCRGLARSEAESILVRGFCEEALGRWLEMVPKGAVEAERFESLWR